MVYYLANFALIVFDKRYLGIDDLPEKLCLGSWKDFKLWLACQLCQQTISFLGYGQDSVMTVIVFSNVIAISGRVYLYNAFLF